MKKELFLSKANMILGQIVDAFNALPELKLDSLPKDKTALVIVDMVNGFAKEGLLSSPRINRLVEPIAKLQEKCKALDIPMIAFADAHTQDSMELKNYVPHCLAGTPESEIVDELKGIGGYTLIPKNSTNGFLEEAFQEWYNEHPEIMNWIVVGDCTDICIMNFALTLKNDCNRRNVEANVVVPMALVETYDLNTHEGDLMNVMALHFMLGQGIQVVKSIT